MSEFNRVIIGNSPYDQKSLIEGLTKAFEIRDVKLQDYNGPVRLELDGEHLKAVAVSGETNTTELEP